MFRLLRNAERRSAKLTHERDTGADRRRCGTELLAALRARNFYFVGHLIRSHATVGRRDQNKIRQKTCRFLVK